MHPLLYYEEDLGPGVLYSWDSIGPVLTSESCGIWSSQGLQTGKVRVLSLCRATLLNGHQNSFWGLCLHLDMGVQGPSLLYFVSALAEQGATQQSLHLQSPSNNPVQ